VFAKAAYPAGAVSALTLASTDDYLARAEPPPWLGRLVLEGRNELTRTLRAQAVDAG
jgi:aminopeptidase N